MRKKFKNEKKNETGRNEKRGTKAEHIKYKIVLTSLAPSTTPPMPRNPPVNLMASCLYTYPTVARREAPPGT